MVMVTGDITESQSYEVEGLFLSKERYKSLFQRGQIKQMNRLVLFLIIVVTVLQSFSHAGQLSKLKHDQRLAGFEVKNLYTDSNGNVMGAKFVHISTGAPVFLLQLESLPQVFTWVETPNGSDEGLPHSMEHLFIKGTKGRYFQLLQELHLGRSGQCTTAAFVCYGLSSGSGMDDFFQSFHAMLDDIYRPDFTDVEAEREFYHFGIANNGPSRKKLIEQGTVYNEQRA